MAVSDVEAVLHILRKNGFTEKESALKEEMTDINELGSLDFERFLFPMPPLVRIPASSRRPEIDFGRGGEGSGSSGDGSSSDDEFVSLGSSTSGCRCCWFIWQPMIRCGKACCGDDCCTLT